MYILIKTTTNSKKIANQISDSILNKRLSPCVQIKTCDSKYLWDNKIIQDNEYIIEIKTVKLLLDENVKIIKTIHNYDIPEITFSTFNIINDEYKEWFNEILSI